MKTVARLVTRLQGEGDGLILGAAFTGQAFFEPNTVYEVIESLGALTIHKVGQSSVAGIGETVNDSPILQTWASDAGDVLSIAGKALFLTREEAHRLNQSLEGN